MQITSQKHFRGACRPTKGPFQRGFGPWDEGPFALGRGFQGNETGGRGPAGVAQDPEFGRSLCAHVPRGAVTRGYPRSRGGRWCRPPPPQGSWLGGQVAHLSPAAQSDWRCPVPTQGASCSPLKRMPPANLRTSLKFHGLPLSGGLLAITSIQPDLHLAQVCLLLAARPSMSQK